MFIRRADDDDDDPYINYVSPETEVNIGLWTLFAGAAVLLFLRLWVKLTRRHGLWYDDYILIASWIVLLLNNALISHQYATGYVPMVKPQKWDDRMHILINISSCGTLIGQAWTKTAFGVTLLRMTNRWQQWVLWFCIATMNAYMIAKVFLQWGKLCDEKSYDVYWRLDFCVSKKFRDDFKEGGNVYNIIMDFVFALFPWIITWKLDMRRAEKFALCATLSLGMIVAIVSAIRTAWKNDGNKRDPYYYWRNGMSNIWFSSEVAGTIMVQCIPVLRPFIRDVHTSLTSKKLSSTTGDVGVSRTVSNANSKHYSGGSSMGFDFGFSKKNSGVMELKSIPEGKDEENYVYKDEPNERDARDVQNSRLRVSLGRPLSFPGFNRS